MSLIENKFIINNYVINTRLSNDLLDITILDSILYDYYFTSSTSFESNIQPNCIYNLIIDYFNNNKDIKLDITKTLNNTINLNILLDSRYWNINTNIVLYKNLNIQDSNTKHLLHHINELELLLDKHINSLVIIFDKSFSIQDTTELFIGYTINNIIQPSYMKLYNSISRYCYNGSYTTVNSVYRDSTIDNHIIHINYIDLLDKDKFINGIKKLNTLTNLKSLTIDCINTIPTYEYLKFIPQYLESLILFNYDDTTLNNIVHLKNLKYLKLYSKFNLLYKLCDTNKIILSNVSVCIKKLLETSPKLQVKLSSKYKAYLDSTDKEISLLQHVIIFD